MINSGKLSYTSVVKSTGRVLKLLIHQSLLECLVPLDGVIDDVKVTQNLQVLTALVYMIYNIESLYLKLKTMVLKGLLRLEMSILSFPSSGYEASGAQARTFFTNPIPRGEILEKNLDPAMLEFSLSGHPGAFLNLPKNRLRSGNLLTTKIPTHHAKLQILQITPLLSVG